MSSLCFWFVYVYVKVFKLLDYDNLIKKIWIDKKCIRLLKNLKYLIYSDG